MLSRKEVKILSTFWLQQYETMYVDKDQKGEYENKNTCVKGGGIMSDLTFLFYKFQEIRSR